MILQINYLEMGFRFILLLSYIQNNSVNKVNTAFSSIYFYIYASFDNLLCITLKKKQILLLYSTCDKMHPLTILANSQINKNRLGLLDRNR